MAGNEPPLNALRRLSRHQQERLMAGAIFLALGVAIFFVVLRQNPYAVDWHYTYRPATLAMLRGQDPYETVQYFFAPPWTLIPLIPFAVLPETIGRSLFFVLSIGMFAYIGYRLGGKPLAVLFFLLCPPVANCIQTGNIEWLPLLGVVLPPQIGLIFLAMKPQSTAALALWLLVEAWHRGGVKEVLRIAWPVILVGALSMLPYGLWPLKGDEIFGAAGTFNVSLWPQGLVIGAVLLTVALRDRSQELAMMAGPFFSPYTILLSWSISFAGLVNNTLLIGVASVAGWVMWLIYLSMVR